MAYIESHQELGRHPKSKKLARLLGVSLPTVIGHLHLLWWWSLDYAPDGQLGRFEADVIADGCLWEGKPELFVEALRTARFVNEDGTIHDWFEYAGKLVHKRREDAERKRAARFAASHGGEMDADGAETGADASFIYAASPSDVRPTSDGHPADGAGNNTNNTNNTRQTTAAQQSGASAGQPPCWRWFQDEIGREPNRREQKELTAAMQRARPPSEYALRHGLRQAAVSVDKETALVRYALKVSENAPHPELPNAGYQPAPELSPEVRANYERLNGAGPPGVGRGRPDQGRGGVAHRGAAHGRQ